MRALAIVLAALAVGGVVVLPGAQGRGGSSLAQSADTGPLLGITGDIARFKTLTGQESLIHQAFLGWGQGQTFGSQFAALLPTLAPIPMLHLGTGGRDRKETITPRGIASGQGDGYLIALNHAISVWGKGIYVRPMAEMNGGSNFYAGYDSNGQPRDSAHSPASYRLAFARIYLLLHGGSATAVNAKLRGLGLPPVAGGDLQENPFPRLRLLWSPLAGGNPRVPGNAPEAYYPGRGYVDVEGGDIYEESGGAAPWDQLEALFKHARANGKPFSVPEWGLFGIDDAAFVKRMCTFLGTHRATESAVFYESRAGSTFDLQPKPDSRQAYSQCVTPLAGPLPAWASANVPGGGATLTALTLTPTPPSGGSPLAVRFAIVAKLSVPIARWELLFGDGSDASGTGPPPSTFPHTYRQNGIYQAMLFVFQAPPFDLADAQFFTSAIVTAGTGATPVVGFVPSSTSGRAPLKISFRIDLAVPGTITSWTLVYGDGNSRSETGTPPHFAGHTYTSNGTFRPLLILNGGGGNRFAATADITASGPGGGGGGGGGGGSTTTSTGAAAPPATGRPTGTVLVNGRPFTGGPIPYNSRVDVTRGSLVLTTDTGTIRVFGAGGITAIFQLLRGTDSGRPIVELRLVGGDFSVCPKRKKSSAVKTAAATTTVRQLWGNGKGRFRTRGRYASATVRGTFWLTADRCDGTLIRMRVGVIEVSDFPNRRQVTIRPPRTYLAKP